MYKIRLHCIILISLVFMASVPSPGFSGHRSCAETLQDEPASITQLNMQLTSARNRERIILLIKRGESFQALGYFREAEKDFRSALEKAKASDYSLLEIIAGQSLGYIHFLQGRTALAETLLRSALENAVSRNNPILAASSANRLGTVLVNQERTEEAYIVYQEALKHVKPAHDPGLEAGIRCNLARILSDNTLAMNQLTKAWKTAQKLKSGIEKTDLFLSIAAQVLRRETGETNTKFAFEILTKAYKLAAEQGAARQISQAAGKLGAMYEKNSQIQEAMTLTQKALETARQLEAHDLLLNWEWQLGRLLRSKNDIKRAMAAFRRAVFHIEAIRQDIPIRYQDGRSSFRETLAPIYMGLADMLLAQSGKEDNDSAKQNLLREAREVVEQIKQSELTDYFRDPCIAALTRGISSLSSATAVFYPVILADRLELLVDTGGRLERKTSPVNREKLEQDVLNLTHALRKKTDFKKPAQDIFDWLIRPIKKYLDDQGVTTLVYVPDGVLRLLPIAALLDKSSFLVEHYAVVIAPGMTLLDPAPLERKKMVSLLAGMSKPGPVIFDLPQNFWNALCAPGAAQQNRGLRGLTVELSESESPGKLPETDRTSPGAVSQIKEALTLPGVDKEIEQLSKGLPGKVMLNEAFRIEDFSTELAGASYRIIHIASHGFFGGTPEQNFIMTYDKRLDMDRLGALIRPRQLADRPVELICLSACQTAEGDDRSPLGLTGVVLKSGARSALGSLWPVWDTAAQELLPRFYTKLNNPKITKAEALQQAQIALMKQKEFSHPFYWSSFILVGNWL